MISSSGKRYWFYAKEYGWGWGLPATREGWLVFAVYFMLLPAGMLVFSPDRHLGAYMAYTAALTAGLIAICWITGEPPAWRWGTSNRAERRLNPRAYLAMHVFLGPVLLGVAIFFRMNLPTEMNHRFGYRTELSFSSQAAWDEAQRFSANLLIVLAAITIVYQIVSSLLMRPIVSFMTSAVLLVLVAVVSVPITEWHLHRHLNSPIVEALQSPGR